LLSSGDPRRQAEALTVLAQLGEPASPYKPKIREWTNSPSPYLRAQAMKTMIMLGDSAADYLSAATAMVRDQSAPVNALSAAMFVIAETGSGGAPAVPALIRALDNEQLFGEALGALQAVGPAAKEALPRLRELALQHPAHAEQIQYAIETIENLVSEDAQQ
jgi:hypothetical protein